jgi:hypothetical protein
MDFQHAFHGGDKRDRRGGADEHDEGEAFDHNWPRAGLYALRRSSEARARARNCSGVSAGGVGASFARSGLWYML